MANIRKSGQFPKPHRDELPPVNAEMVIRVWAPNTRDRDSVHDGDASTQDAGLLALIEDVAGAHSGIFHFSRGRWCISSLNRPDHALVIARQVQLGLRGFRSKDGTAPVAVSIVIDTTSNTSAPTLDPGQENVSAENVSVPTGPKEGGVEPSHDLLTLLKLAKPAQILLTHDHYQQISSIKGLPLKPFPPRFGVQEYLWTSEDKLEVLQSEPQLTLAALPPVASPPAPPAISKVGAASNVPASNPASRSRLVEETLAKVQQRWKAVLTKPRRLLFAGCGLIFVVLIAVAIRVISAPLPQSPANPSPAPLGQSLSSASHNPAQGATTPIRTDSSAVAPGNTSAPSSPKSLEVPPPKPKARRGDKGQSTVASESTSQCTVNESERSQYLQLAQNKRGHGDYAGAVRLFRQILACDPGNGAAKDGLNRALEGEQQSRNRP